MAIWSRKRIAGAFAPTAITRARRARNTANCEAKPPRIYTDADCSASTSSIEAEEVRGSRKRYWQDVASRRGAADHGQGADDGDRLHRLRARLGRPVYPREQAGLAPGQPPSRPRHPEPLRHPRLPRARALGAGFRPDGRRAGGLRLRPGTLLLADPPPDELDGR